MSTLNIESVEKYIADSKEQFGFWSSYEPQEIGRIALPEKEGKCCVTIGVGGISWPPMSDEKMALIIQAKDGTMTEYRSWMPFNQGTEQIFDDVPSTGQSLIVLYTDNVQLVKNDVTATKTEQDLKAQNEKLQNAIVSNKTSENISTAIKSIAVIAVVGGVLALAAYAAPYLKTFAAVKK